MRNISYTSDLGNKQRIPEIEIQEFAERTSSRTWGEQGSLGDDEREKIQ